MSKKRGGNETTVVVNGMSITVVLLPFTRNVISMANEEWLTSLRRLITATCNTHNWKAWTRTFVEPAPVEPEEPEAGAIPGGAAGLAAARARYDKAREHFENKALPRYEAEKRKLFSTLWDAFTPELQAVYECQLKELFLGWDDESDVTALTQHAMNMSATGTVAGEAIPEAKRIENAMVTRQAAKMKVLSLRQGLHQSIDDFI